MDLRATLVTMDQCAASSATHAKLCATNLETRTHCCTRFETKPIQEHSRDQRGGVLRSFATAKLSRHANRPMISVVARAHGELDRSVSVSAIGEQQWTRAPH